MKKLLLVLTLGIALTACNSTSNDTADSPQIETENKGNTSNTPQSVPDVAIQFINDYITHLNSSDGMGMVEWVNKNELVTDGFKEALEELVEEAEAENPEMGLDYDPILNAQDFPDGFELESFDERMGIVTLKGIDFDSFKLELTVIEVEGKLQVNGCGDVNTTEKG